jgi:hypothetical protein
VLFCRSVIVSLILFTWLFSCIYVENINKCMLNKHC